MKPEFRTALAFLGASVIPAAYQAVAFPLSGEGDAASVLGTFVVAYWFSALSAVVVGVPALFLLRRLNLAAWWSAVGCGALAGVATYVAVVSGNSEWEVALRFFLLGASAGLVFWLVFRSGPAWPVANNGT